MSKVRPKKHLGQHFLNDLSAAKQIVDALSPEGKYTKVIEVGPGMGVLTQYLQPRTDLDLYLAEIDTESIVYLAEHFPELKEKTFEADFLQLHLEEKMELAKGEKIAIIGNFPYNISSQIFFKAFDQRDKVDEIVCMLQKEVAMRIASGPGNKTYGILSVLLQAFYDIEYLFTVLPDAFTPPPKVDSGVIRLKRNSNVNLDCDERKFFTMVKMAFNQRRKKLSNSIKGMGEIGESPLLDLRAERLHYTDFVTLVNLLK
ncbi:dimethyladenosine transferase [Spirosomataceae bacterium TFI 002]|nr:dimethyladenosine transferase [Spirosomataceae bacterium TFI 002]